MLETPQRSLPPLHAAESTRHTWRWVAVGVLLVALLAGGFVIAAFALSGATLASDSVGLARIDVQALGGSVASAHAVGPGGHPVPIAIRNGRIVPRARLAPGERVTVHAVVRRPSSVGWLVGADDRETLTLKAPLAKPRARWLAVSNGREPRIAFDQSVSAIAVGSPGHLERKALPRPHRSVAVPGAASAGSVDVAAAARPWEKLGRPRTVTWFPASGRPAVVATPAPAADVSPTEPLRLTFSKPVSDVLGSARPTLTPSTPGSWRVVDSHTLVFHPSGYGAAMGTSLKASLPHTVSVIGSNGSSSSAKTIAWNVPAGSTLRLQQLLAEDGYMPLAWKPADGAVARTADAQVRAAVDPPRGTFTWRYPSTPSSLQQLWSPGRPDVITRGALMAFEDDHGMTADGVAGPQVWHTLIADAISGKGHSSRGYSYVYVTTGTPEQLTLWHDGHTVTTSPANTGIPAAPTALGTYPVFEHISVGTMSGTNPDGSHYNDPGIRYISYFNGGDAVHAFDRASFGTPQSLGCVELPLAAAAKVWPYMPIGTLVTIE